MIAVGRAPTIFQLGLYPIFSNLQFSRLLDFEPYSNSSIIDDPLPTYKYIYFKTTFMCPRSIAEVPSSQALPGFLITAPHLCAFLLSLVRYLCGDQKKKRAQGEAGFYINKQTNEQTHQGGRAL